MKIPVCVPKTPRNALRYVTQVIERNWVSALCLDEEVDFIGRLERGLSGYVGARHGVATTSGTTALHLALAAGGVGPGDEVILPATTMIATASTVVQQGAIPRLVDVDRRTWCIDAGQVEAAITPRTRAIVPVHLYGFPAAVDPLIALARRHELLLIEDAAEALGTRSRGRPVGGLGDIGCFSFYANKVVTSGEGGMAVTSDDDLARRMRSLKDHAFGEPRFIHERFGFNYRMSNLTAAYAYASFEEVDEAVAARVAHARRYSAGLAAVEGIELPPRGGDEGDASSHWMYALLVTEARYGCSKQTLRERLKRDFGVDTRDVFYPLHRQPALRAVCPAVAEQRFPVADLLWERGLYLPSSTGLGEAQVDHVIAAIATIQREERARAR